MEKRAFSISEFCTRYGIGRTKTYEEIASGRLRAVKVGRRTLVIEGDAESWLVELARIATKPTDELSSSHITTLVGIGKTAATDRQ